MKRLRLTAPSRLHFGLLNPAGRGRLFGGAGVMVEPPELGLQISPADRFSVDGPGGDRVREFALRWQEFYRRPQLPAAHLEVLTAPAPHAGLGSGTQLALATATALNAASQFPSPGPVELARSVGRAKRSAIGTYGFARGGLIVDGGKQAGDEIARLECRLAVPDAWRFVLVRQTSQAGLAGRVEQAAFDGLPEVSEQITTGLVHQLRDHLVPAVAQGDFEQFSDSVYQFGRLAGSCFASWQGGPYNGASLQRLVDLIRSMGVRGVGQSSWGPTIFALLPCVERAKAFAARLSDSANEELEIRIARPNNQGFRLKSV